MNRRRFTPDGIAAALLERRLYPSALVAPPSDPPCPQPDGDELPPPDPEPNPGPFPGDEPPIH